MQCVELKGPILSWIIMIDVDLSLNCADTSNIVLTRVTFYKGSSVSLEGAAQQVTAHR